MELGAGNFKSGLDCCFNQLRLNGLSGLLGSEYPIVLPFGSSIALGNLSPGRLAYRESWYEWEDDMVDAE